MCLKLSKINTVYHTAAYVNMKSSLVEENICVGIKNNVFGTSINEHKFL